jgi:acetyl-CoA acetyltransferase
MTGVPAGYEGVYIVGVGETAYTKRTSEPLEGIIWNAIDIASRSAGLDNRSIDGLAVTSFGLAPENAVTLANHYGLPCRWVHQGVSGGAAGIVAIQAAARAIQAGDASVVACVAADIFDTDSHMGMRRTAGQSSYMAPWGYGAANGVFALHTRQYMERYGVAREGFGRLAVAQRYNAGLNPNALLREPLTLDDYLEARRIADPLRLYDCVHPCCGGNAVIVVGEEVASRLPGPAVEILAAGQAHNWPPHDIYDDHAAWEGLREALYEQAGVGPEDQDFAQLYDDYPVMAFVQLEALGICSKGEAAAFVAEHDVTVKGDFPINTGGGQLSAGQCGAGGGMIGLTEAVTQLRGEAGARQVECRQGLVVGYGMVGYGRGLSASAAILRRSGAVA